MNIDTRDPGESCYFVGTEVERSRYHGLRTLFVAGIQSTVKIAELAKANNVEHVYLAANQSFGCQGYAAWLEQALAFDLPVTLDVPFTQLQEVAESARRIAGHVHIMFSVPSPNLCKIPSFTIKLDDDIRNITNPGVWCVAREVLPDCFTPWSAYTTDSKL